jgi:hypothetical protein
MPALDAISRIIGCTSLACAFGCIMYSVLCFHMCLAVHSWCRGTAWCTMNPPEATSGTLPAAAFFAVIRTFGVHVAYR